MAARIDLRSIVEIMTLILNGMMLHDFIIMTKILIRQPRHRNAFATLAIDNDSGTPSLIISYGHTLLAKWLIDWLATTAGMRPESQFRNDGRQR